MAEVARFALLGIGPGAIYALIALGVVLVYRGSGVVNFGAGALTSIAAIVYIEVKAPLGTPIACVLAVAAGAASAGAFQVLVMTPMKRASPLARIIATLAFLLAVQSAGDQKFGDLPRSVASFLPQTNIKLGGNFSIGEEQLIIAALSLVLTGVLWLAYRRSRFGMATSGIAENANLMSTLGWSADRLAAANWAIGGALAGVGGVLLVQVIGFDPTNFGLVVVPALAVALVGGFRSFPLTFAGGVGIGMLQSYADYLYAKHPNGIWHVPTIGLSDGIPFLVIMVLLVVRGRSLPLRSHLADILPRVGSPKLGVGWISALVLVSAGSVFLFSTAWSSALSYSACLALITLSSVVVTGYCGQISLAQVTIAGIGALISTRFAAALGLPFLVCLLLGILLTIPVGLVVALPAVRARGVNLAVATLGFAVILNSVVLSNPQYTGGAVTGTQVSDPTLFGFDIQSAKHPRDWALFCLLLAVCGALVVRNLRAGWTGMRLIAVRDNERAAASLGVSVVRTKLYAFGVAAALAACGGVLLGFTSSQVDFTQYTELQSIGLVVVTVLGGIGLVAGGLVAGVIAAGGLLQYLLSHIWASGGWFEVITATMTVGVVVAHPNGIVDDISRLLSSFVQRIRHFSSRAGSGTERSSAAAAGTPGEVRLREQRSGKALELRDISVRFGATEILRNVSLEVRPGEVVGLIGPNGAGKTTLIDVATGFLPHYGGSVWLGGQRLDSRDAAGRARAGLSRSFQSLELFDDLSVSENLRVFSQTGGFARELKELFVRSATGLSLAAETAVAEFGLAPDLESYPAALSSAKRRTVAIARAVATAPAVLLLDEPGAGLDDVASRELGHLIRRLADDWGIAVLLVEHNVGMVMRVCDRIAALNFGEKIADDSADIVRHDPKVVESYLGDTDIDGADPDALVQVPTRTEP